MRLWPATSEVRLRTAKAVSAKQDPVCKESNASRPQMDSCGRHEGWWTVQDSNLRPANSPKLLAERSSPARSRA